ncbi:hypothetical protein SAMN02745126_05941 [Enhydrobacter aerosaccus]|uniref:Uncharacterized protein n=2 Tax=Enhydrobacter aerosaccus TaxID=225324 RepID=A0A1T4TB28_9HYPH|nr:hypothetical protein SAMN02745126_05941 [Enhydrobacter aerosaccus]
MQDFIRRRNIKLLQEAIEKERDQSKRLVLERLLADQQRLDISGKRAQAAED